tara:strand:+ start:107 stop:301 length:195 start_codon:yes stop_codon:yes gene_type:complete
MPCKFTPKKNNLVINENISNPSKILRDSHESMNLRKSSAISIDNKGNQINLRSYEYDPSVEMMV